MLFVLDTNTVAYFLKGMGGVGENLLSRPRSAIAVPSVVLYEIEYGVQRSPLGDRRRRQLEQFLGTLEVLPFGTAEAHSAASIRIALESEGRSIGPHDVMIAATALANAATLVTHNVRELSRVPGLQLVDWYEPSRHP